MRAARAHDPPRPNGQMPAKARNSVLLPEPEAPVTSTLSPGSMPRSKGASNGLPFGRSSSTSLVL